MFAHCEGAICGAGSTAAASVMPLELSPLGPWLVGSLTLEHLRMPGRDILGVQSVCLANRQPVFLTNSPPFAYALAFLHLG